MSNEVESGRHPFRFMVKLMIFFGILAAAGKFLASKRDEYAGLTEAEAKAKMESKLGPRFGEEKASEIANQVVPVLKERGFLKKEAGEGMMDKAKDAATDMADKAKDAAGDMAAKVGDVAGTVKSKTKDVAEDVADKAEDVVDKMN
jgi:gas vesicle protein